LSEIYLISPEKILVDEFSIKLDNIFKFSGGCGAFQLRLKNSSLKEVSYAVEKLLPICHNYGVPFFINDYWELARYYDVDGIHIGQSDANIKDLRKEFSNQKIIGVSCQNSKHNAMVAAENGADYVSFGAFYDTKTKKNTVKADLEILNWWNNFTNIPVAAIGGINYDNLDNILSCKPDFICLISAIWSYDNHAERLYKFNQRVKTT
jgi:thiamine-phosphate pyrophosphorylase